MKRICIAVLLVVFSLHAGGADQEFNSDRPGVADGPDTVGRGRVQLEAGFQRDRRSGGEEPRRELFFPTLVRIGLGDDTEARLESDLYSWMRFSHGTRAEGWAPFALGLKHKFVEASGARPALGAILRVSPPSGSDSRRQSHTTGDLRLAAEWELGERWSLNPNIGFGYDQDDEGRRFSTRLFAATLAYRPQPKLELSLDVAAQKPEAPGGRTGTQSWASIAYLVKPDLQVDFGLGGRSAGSTPPRRFISAGFSARF
jgi:hypothetical protein